jgi:hypothetical protein
LLSTKVAITLGYGWLTVSFDAAATQQIVPTTMLA